MGLTIDSGLVVEKWEISCTVQRETAQKVTGRRGLEEDGVNGY
jgi:hypothetical protein